MSGMLAAVAWGLFLTGTAAGIWFVSMRKDAVREMSPEGRKRAASFAWQWEMLNRSNYASSRGEHLHRRLVLSAVYQLVAWGSALAIFSLQT